MKYFKWFFLSVLLLSTLSFKGVCQNNQGAIEGVITDLYGAVLPEATVTLVLIQSSKPVELKTKTDSEGKFRFEFIPAGVYELKVNALGTLSKKNITLKEGQNQKIEMVLGLGCNDESESKNLTDYDKGQIISLALEDFLLTGKVGNYEWIIKHSKSGVVVSTENLPNNWNLSLQKIKLTLKTISQIQHIADTKGDFVYLSFSHFRITESCVAFNLDMGWVRGKRSQMVYLSGGGNRYEFRKQNGKWVGKVIFGWIS